MNIVTSTLLVPQAGSSKFGDIVNHLKDFLVAQAGWTVAGSSDGVTGGMDATDRPSDMLGPVGATEKWFVLQSPHASAADRIQILYSGATSSSADEHGCWRYNPQADYADNGTALPTSAYELIGTDGAVVQSSVDIRYHFLCDTDAPYGFACFGSTSLSTSSTKQGAHALIPLDTVNPNNPGKPYVVFGWSSGDSFFQQDLGRVSDNTSVARCIAEPPNAPQVPYNAPACDLRNDTGVLINNLFPDDQNRDSSMPIIFQHQQHFYGVTEFIRWTGIERHFLDTLSDGINPRARICLGDASLPWDGTTAPAV